MRVLVFSAVFALVTLFKGATSDFVEGVSNGEYDPEVKAELKRMCVKLYGDGKSVFTLKSGDKCKCNDTGYFNCYQVKNNKKYKSKTCIKNKSTEPFVGYRKASCYCYKNGLLSCHDPNMSDYAPVF
ncbi:hypothetical protein BB561_002968 [Smittium simulii]|uniref:Uncharacterized protein n=1 Tax=Smittium simulii TaxID=133385 RepID=A0A2T9YNQ5_9FUNG|nr:hypothetical protein BB561_002968 [Smittium simulii]